MASVWIADLPTRGRTRRELRAELPPRYIVGESFTGEHVVVLEEAHAGSATAWCACGFQSFTCTGHVLGLTPPACAERDVNRHAAVMNARAALLERTRQLQENDDEH